jgi:hypothetical protein
MAVQDARPFAFFAWRVNELLQREAEAAPVVSSGMRLSTHTISGVRLTLLASVLGLAAGLAGCNGSSGNPLGPIGNLGPGGNAAQIRFVNGSPDAGPVQIFIDNQQQFCTNGATGSGCAVSYGQTTTYAVNLNAGQHAVVLKGPNGTAISVPAATLSVNAGSKYSVVLTGELHPAYTATANLTLTTFTDQPFNTPAGGAAVNFHYASTYMASLSGAPLQFGYFINNNAASSANLGQTVAFGSETTPQGIPGTSLNVPITFFAGSVTGPTATPGQISTTCSSNALPCSTGNLSLYLIDGPSASSAPTTPPANINATAKAVFVGTFD